MSPACRLFSRSSSVCLCTRSATSRSRASLKHNKNTFHSHLPSFLHSQHMHLTESVDPCLPCQSLSIACRWLPNTLSLSTHGQSSVLYLESEPSRGALISVCSILFFCTKGGGWCGMVVERPVHLQLLPLELPRFLPPVLKTLLTPESGRRNRPVAWPLNTHLLQSHFCRSMAVAISCCSSCVCEGGSFLTSLFGLVLRFLFSWCRECGGLGVSSRGIPSRRLCMCNVTDFINGPNTGNVGEAGGASACIGTERGTRRDCVRQKDGWCDKRLVICKRRCMLTSNCAMYGRNVWVVGGSVGGGSGRKHQRAI